MKRIMIFAFTVMFIFMLSSCKANIGDELAGGFQNARTKLLDELTSEESVKINQMANDIIRCFTEKDKEALKNLFCEQIRNNPDLDEEIDRALEYLNCDSYITSTIDDTASGGSSSGGGKRTEWYIAPEIPYFHVLKKIDSETDPRGYEHEDCYFSISYYWQITYEADKTLEGLHYMVIELLNVDWVIIGEKTSITNYNPYGYFEV